MAKAKSVPVTVSDVEVNIMTADPSTLSREQLLARYNANKETVSGLRDENKIIEGLYKSATSSEKKSNAEAKIAALQAKLAALQNPTVPSVEPGVESPVEGVAVNG
jgi:uncharacterized protein YktA (UPF0223 family)